MYDPQSVNEDNVPIERNQMRIAFIELYNPIMHGETKEIQPNVKGHYLVEWIPSRDNVMNQQILNEYGQLFSQYPRPTWNPTIPAYTKWCNYAHKNGTLELVKTHILPSGEMIGILYTYLIRRIQRRFRTRLNKRRQYAKEVSNPRNLDSRSRTGVYHSIA